MSSKQPDSTPPKAGGLWARLFGSGAATKPEAANAVETLKNVAAADPPDLLTPLKANAPAPELGRGVAAVFGDDMTLPAAQAFPGGDTIPPEPVAKPAESGDPSTLPPEPMTASQPCPACGAVRVGLQEYCGDCGWMFSNGAPGEVAASELKCANTGNDSTPSVPNSRIVGMRIKNRYEIVRVMGERGPVTRYTGMDHGATPPRPVVIVRGPKTKLMEQTGPLAPPAFDANDEFAPSFDDTLPAVRLPQAMIAEWPSVAWEQALLEKLKHPGLPRIIERHVEGETEYLIEGLPDGQTLWDAWDDPAKYAHDRYGYLEQTAEMLHALHKAGVVCQSLRPDIITVTPDGSAVLTDLGELLPLPIPAGTPIRASLYTAPEIVLSPDKADARADLYGFGAMVYALEYLHHDLEDKDFERQFAPKQITETNPDVHPGLFRLVSKTFHRDPNSRFPTDEAGKTDRTGFIELMRTLEVCRKTFDSVRLDVASWTTTGMVRTGNEDAFCVLHGVESRQDELTEYAMVLLCDGMGGYDAGEVAAALCIQAMRKFLLQQPIFSALASGEKPAPGVFNIDEAKKTVLAALKHANKEVFTAARTPGKGKRGMGCTAECVYVDNRYVIVGHVGDSRTYHLHQGRLVQLTRDQTLVNRLVELGQISAEEAENHPRKNELQQAIGGQPDVDPGIYHGTLQRGDWVLVCSDGLTNHIPAADLAMMLSREAGSAEYAARRLMNLVNLRGATDNATIVVIRAS